VAISLGYVAIGLPQAGAALASLKALVRGQNVVIVGDRDAHEVGQKGMEAVFEMLKPICSSVVKVLPPDPIKDLRAWAPTPEAFAKHIDATGDTSTASDILDNTGTYGMTEEWLKQAQMRGKDRLLHCLHGQFYEWADRVYKEVDTPKLHGWWYRWFQDRKIKKPTKGGVELVDINPNKRFVQDIEHAARALCYVQADESAHEPLILSGGRGRSMDLERAVVFRNGIYHVSRDALTPITPDIFLTTTLPYDYDPRQRCPVWLWAIADWFNGQQDCIDLLQEWIGYCTIASNSMQSMIFLFGRPGSGKSTLEHVIRAVLGGERCCAADTSNFTNLFGPGKLLNKYLAIMSESRDTNRKDIDRLLQTWKAITGGDVVNINKKYKDAFDARLFCRLMYIANDVLPFDDSSQAMARRTNLLYFPNMYDTKDRTPDRTLEQRLVAEAPGVAIWALEGLRRLLANGKFTRPQSSEEHIESIGELTNPIGLMISECCEFKPTGVTDCNTLYDLWVSWCRSTNTRNNLNRIAFGVKLRNLPEPLIRTRLMRNGKRFYGYEGIEIVDEAMKNYLEAV
jgi:P4 family phage/plasmid primase-like protien